MAPGDLSYYYSFLLLGEAHFKIREKLKNHCSYNVKFTVPVNLNKKATEMLYQLPVEYGVLSVGGTNCYVEGQKIYQFVKISNEEYEAMINDFDPIEAPPGPYTIKGRQGTYSGYYYLCFMIKVSMTQGKILWLCGPPGTGKSTAAQIMARNHGHVYYEADTFNQMRNPFIDLNVSNPSLSQYGQKILKGEEILKKLFKEKKPLY